MVRSKLELNQCSKSAVLLGGRSNQDRCFTLYDWALRSAVEQRHLELQVRKSLKVASQTDDFTSDLLPGSNPPQDRHVFLSVVLKRWYGGVFQGGNGHGIYCSIIISGRSPLRPSIDYRRLNNISVKSHYPLLLLVSAFDLLKRASIHDVFKDMWKQFAFLYFVYTHFYFRSHQKHVQHSWKVHRRLLKNNLYCQLRLTGGMDNCSGRVEVLRDGTWGTVCDVFWDLKDASVVCNHLHCGPVLSAKAGGFFADHWHLRLAAGEGRCDGRVEVYHHGVWGRVTDDLWDFKDAEVVCRQLKCGSVVNVYNHGKYGIGKGPVIMSNVSCTGGESYLRNCTFTQADHLPLGGDVGVFCSGNVPVRLVNGAGRCAGRVEVYYDGIWGTVCDDAWDLIDAHIVCKELNCGHAVNITKSSLFGQGSGPVWLDNLKCSANNSALWQCPARPWGENDCFHKEDVGVICSDFMAIRLANGENPCQGRLEVFFNGTWGTVCSDSFGMENAQVVCSQLNCGSAKFIENSATFGEGTGPIWLDDVRCRLGDSLLWQCPSSSWGQHNCKHKEDVGIICSETWPSKPLIKKVNKEKIINPFPKTSNLRLVAGFDNCSGRIEVFFSGTWGTVCDDSWDRHDAAVVCRQLNCGDPVLASGGILFPLGNGTIWMDEVKCKGSEKFLSDCQISTLHRHDCGHKETVGVICSDHQPHTPPFSNLRAFIYTIPFILGSLLVIVSLYLIKSQRRQFQNGDRKSRPSVHKFAEPFYEEIAIQETGPGVGDSQSIGSADKLEYCLVGDLHDYQNEDMEARPGSRPIAFPETRGLLPCRSAWGRSPFRPAPLRCRRSYKSDVGDLKVSQTLPRSERRKVPLVNFISCRK
ncbi:scavenger receptor cysteine-rich domain-containing group B protein-like [Mobula birostris]|uniref:scavenger receptor cysteine-rich domain-containing group B protein-like n=1 Tax=Mobula birostris TaxID=1983395 RepID=UPI003B287E0B